MKIRVSEHQGVSPRTGKRVKGMLSMSLRDHMLSYDHTKYLGKISLSLVESRNTTYWKQKKAFSLNEQPHLKQEQILSGAIFILAISENNRFIMM